MDEVKVGDLFKDRDKREKSRTLRVKAVIDNYVEMEHQLLPGRHVTRVAITNLKTRWERVS
jgi:hypothetical protein